MQVNGNQKTESQAEIVINQFSDYGAQEFTLKAKASDLIQMQIVSDMAISKLEKLGHQMTRSMIEFDIKTQLFKLTLSYQTPTTGGRDLLLDLEEDPVSH